MKTFEEFMKALETDDALKAKVKEAFEGAEVKNEEARISALVKTATDNGYNASTEDFAKYQSGSQVLDEDELSLVSAGEGYCVFNYGCIIGWNTCAISNEVNIHDEDYHPCNQLLWD